MRLHCRSVYTSYKQYAEGWMAWYNLQQSKARQGMNHANRICIPNWKKEKNFFFYFCFQNVSLSPRKNTLVTITLWIGSFLVHFNDYLNIHKFSEKETSFFYSFYSILVFSMLFYLIYVLNYAHTHSMSNFSCFFFFGFFGLFHYFCSFMLSSVLLLLMIDMNESLGPNTQSHTQTFEGMIWHIETAQELFLISLLSTRHWSVIICTPPS